MFFRFGEVAGFVVGDDVDLVGAGAWGVWPSDFIAIGGGGGEGSGASDALRAWLAVFGVEDVD